MGVTNEQISPKAHRRRTQGLKHHYLREKKKSIPELACSKEEANQREAVFRCRRLERERNQKTFEYWAHQRSDNLLRDIFDELY